MGKFISCLNMGILKSQAAEWDYNELFPIPKSMPSYGNFENAPLSQ